MEQDVLVLGAGLGGLCAALALARRGFSVTIVDQQAPPWPRVGESFDWETPRLLEHFGLDLESLYARRWLTRKPGVVLWSNSTRADHTTTLSPSPLLMRALGRATVSYHGDRSRIDEFILARAQEAGCRFIEDRVRKVELRGDRVEGVETQTHGRLNARYHIDASGRARLVGRAAGARARPCGPKMINIRRRHRHDYDGRGTRLYLLHHEGRLVWAWNIHVDERTTDIGVVIPASYLRETSADHRPRARPEDVYAEILSKIEPLSGFLASHAPEGPLHVCSFRNDVVERIAGPNWLSVGEAAFVLDPISSGGVTAALRSGRFASILIGDALERGTPALTEREQRDYQQRLSQQVEFVNATVRDLFDYHLLWNEVGLAFYIRILVYPQFYMNWQNSVLPLRMRGGARLLRVLQRQLRFVTASTVRALDLIHR
ncbi:NAD(P)/FAD-dependent oxidoreductase [Paraliomyxa miuraensis]|nr:NAD(P)/FAD-dependent oxidoreductase [Paraliomyxa miuraensis]